MLPEWDRIYARLESRRRGDTDPQGQPLERYRQALADFPGPKSGRTHVELLRAANLGRLAGLTASAVAADLHATRPDKLREAREAVAKAFEAPDWTPPARTSPRASRPARKPRGDVFTAALARYPDPFPSLWEASPERLHDDIDGDLALLLSAAYDPSELVFIGDKARGQIGRNVRPVREWLNTPRPRGAFIGMNPLTGLPKADGGYRGNACVAATRYVLVEFDHVPLEQQAAFWLAHKLPVFAIIHSGGRSLHAWLRADSEALRARLKELFVAMGADGAVWYPACLSRTPGVKRGDDFQRLLYLDRAWGGAQ